MKVDPRGQRCNAALSAVVLAVVLITGSVWLFAAQAVVFGIGAVFGLRYSPYGYLYRALIVRSRTKARECWVSAGPSSRTSPHASGPKNPIVSFFEQ